MVRVALGSADFTRIARTAAAAMVGEVQCLEWSPAGGLRHTTIVSVSPGS
jgi:hypothetical protein